MALRWGIACAGQICHDFTTAMATLPTGEHQVMAVAARDIQRAKEFAELHKIPIAYSSYEELAANKDIGTVGGGTILDFGVYVLQLVLMIFGPRMPLEVKATGHVNSTGCDDCTAIVLKYPGNKLAMVGTSALANMNNDAVIWGTKGSIRIIDPFWCPTKVLCNNITKEFTLPKGEHPYNCRNSSGLRFEAAEVKRCIRAGFQECPLMTHEESITIATIQEEVNRQLGVTLD